MNETPRFGDDSSERLWFVIALISSTESCVIGYKPALYQTRPSLAQRASQSAQCRFEFSSWCCERSNHTSVINIKYKYIQKLLLCYFLSFGSCIQNPLGSEIWGGTHVNGHDASAIKHPSLDEVKQYIYTNSLGFIMFQVLFVFQDYAFSINAFYHAE